MSWPCNSRTWPKPATSSTAKAATASCRIWARPKGQDKLNQKLTAWWELDFPLFRGEVKKVFKQDIPLKERDEWEAWLFDRQAQHRQQTQAIIRLETALNARVYALFKLTPAEIALIEASTKYRYGEV